MKTVITVSANTISPKEIEAVDRAVRFVRQSYREQGFVTHVDIRDVACGQLFREYTIIAIKEEE